MKQPLKIMMLVLASYITISIHAMVNKPWTILVYIAGANSLDPFVDADLQEMMRVGSNDKVNVLAYVTRHSPGKPKETKKLYINKGSATQIGATEVRDSGDVNTFKDALAWANSYPSDNTMVIMWNHASGFLNPNLRSAGARGICFDDDTNNYLTDRDCLEAFSWAQKTLRNGKKFDLIACDACLMASVEFAYTLASCACYLVASEETIPGDGFEYAYILNQFVGQSPTPLSCAIGMIDAYGKEYAKITDYTLSVIDLQQITPLVDNITNVGKILQNSLSGKNGKKTVSIIQQCLQRTVSFDDMTYADIINLYQNLSNNITKLNLDKKTTTLLQSYLTQGTTLCSKAIKAKIVSSDLKKATGLTIYFPLVRFIDPSYAQTYWTEKNPAWSHFLNAYASA